jgi:hypothetical protein
LTIPTIEEDSVFVLCPVTISLNARDGSETYQKVFINYSTAGTGNPPEIQFHNFFDFGLYARAQSEGESKDGFGNTFVTYTTNASGEPVYTIASRSPATYASSEAELQLTTEIQTTLGSFTVHT